MKLTHILAIIVFFGVYFAASYAKASVCELEDGTKLCSETATSCAAKGGTYNATDNCPTTVPGPTITTVVNCDINGDGVCTSADIGAVNAVAFGQVPLSSFPEADICGADGLVGFCERQTITGMVCSMGDANACLTQYTLHDLIVACASVPHNETACVSLIGL